MKFMTTWKLFPGTRNEATDRFLAGKAAPPAGVTLLGRWHKTDGSGGFSLYESTNPQAMYETSAFWSDVMEIQSTIIVEDAEAAPILAKLKK
jgi:hypothetical protein